MDKLQRTVVNTFIFKCGLASTVEEIQVLMVITGVEAIDE